MESGARRGSNWGCGRGGVRVSSNAKERSLFRSPRLSFRTLNLQGPGRSGLSDSGLLEDQEARFLERGGLRPGEAVNAEQRGPWTAGGAVPRRLGTPGTAVRLPVPDAHRYEGLATLIIISQPLALFPNPSPTRSSFPSPHQTDGRLGVRGGWRVRVRSGGKFRRMD